MILDGDSKVNNAKIYRNSDHMELEKAYETIEWYQNKLKALKESMKPKPIDENTPKDKDFLAVYTKDKTGKKFPTPVFSRCNILSGYVEDELHFINDLSGSVAESEVPCYWLPLPEIGGKDV